MICKLYTLKRGDKFKFIGDDQIVVYKKTDGMYAQCFKDGDDLNDYNRMGLIAAWTDVERID